METITDARRKSGNATPLGGLLSHEPPLPEVLKANKGANGRWNETPTAVESAEYDARA